MTSRRLVAACAAALAAAVAAAAPAPAAPPTAGVLVPGTSLGGLRLGVSEAEVERRWGRAYGVCVACGRPTWYFNYYAFQPAGAAVELHAGRVEAIFTVYAPPGWRTPGGITLGDPIAEVTTAYGALERRQCRGYYALLLPRGSTRSVFYALRGRLWAFALQRPSTPVCR